MLGNLNGWHAVILLASILLLFGAPKLPALARSLGQSARILRSEVKLADQQPVAPDAPTDDAATVPTQHAAAAVPSASRAASNTDAPSAAS